MKNNFSIQRMGLFIQHQLIINYKAYLHYILGLFIGFFAFDIASSLPFWVKGASVTYETAQKIGSIGSAFEIIYIAVSFAITFAFMETPLKRINFLMVPASLLEKFVGRLLITFLIGVIGTNLCFFLADGLRVFIDLCITSHAGFSAIPNYWNGLTKSFNFNIKVCNIPIYLNGLIYLFISFQILNSSVFRKKAFIKGFALWTLIALVCTFMLIVFCYAIDIEDYKYDLSENPEVLNSTLNVLNMAFWAIAVVNIWLSYHNFKKIKVV